MLPTYPSSQNLLSFLISNFGQNDSELIKDMLAEQVILTEFEEIFSIAMMDLLSTISQGLGRGDTKEYFFTNNKQLKSEIIDCLLFRFRVNIQDKELFKFLLLDDLKNWLINPQPIGEYCILQLANDEIIIQLIHERPIKEVSNRKKATLFIPT